MVSEPRIIKKYPNRRLYDTAVSSYVTLENVRQLVLDKVPFVVHDARSDVDITHSVLMQIIFEQEEDGEPIFSTDILRQFIRYYGHDLQYLMTQFLEQSMNVFVQQQEQISRRMDDVWSKTPVDWLADISKQNMALWRSFSAGLDPQPSDKPPKRNKPKSTKSD